MARAVNVAAKTYSISGIMPVLVEPLINHAGHKFAELSVVAEVMEVVAGVVTEGICC